MSAEFVTQIMTAPAVEPVAESPFYIPMTGPAARPRRSLKHDDTFIVLDSHGDIGASAGGPDGLFNADTRYLARLELVLDEVQPLLLGSNLRDDNSALTVDLTNPDVYRQGRIVLHKDMLHIVRTIFLWRGTAYQRIGLQNHGDRPASFDLTLLFDIDFADLFEVRGEHRAARGDSSAVRSSDSKVVLRYVGLDKIERITTLEFCPQPQSLGTARAAFEVTLRPRQVRRIFIRVGMPHAEGAWTGRTFYRHMRSARQALHESSSRAASVDSSNSLFNEVARRSISDLYMLVTDTPVGPYPYAGTPWFSTPFGRDGIITALMTLWVDPSIAKGVLRFLASTQATSLEPERDAEPGKILHEMRHGEMANLREVPFGRYYGSVDSTPLFVLLLGEYFSRTGDLDTVRELWPNALAALHWIDTFGDRDGDGFVEYYRQTNSGLANQGWKDSQDAVFHRNGQYAQGPIALCEVQAYVYGAKHHASILADELGFRFLSVQLQSQAQALRQNFEAKFWCEELSVYALALDGQKQPCRVVSSNSGQVLLTGIADPARAQRVAQTLLGPACFSGWGIRTLGLSEPHYNPMSYHNGSVWPHDNGLIALGLARYGHKAATAQIFTAMFDAASYMDLRRLPELFCGFLRRERNAPTQYPVACSPQAWASATVLALLQACLGLELAEARNEIAFFRPALPSFLDELHLRNLRLTRGSADVLLKRHGSDITVTPTRRDGDVGVVVRY